MEPVLSLCIPTFNRASLLREALQIIGEQWAKEPENSLEVIVSDNASTDDTPQVLQQIAAKFARFPLRVYRAAENQGPDANIYQAIKMAQGTFVYILSDDDILLPGALKKLFSLIQAYPEVDGYSLNIRSFRVTPNEISDCWISLPKDTLIQDCNAAMLLLNPLFLSVFAFRRALIADRNYTAAIGTNLLQSYLFLDVMAHENGIVVTAEPFLAQRQENTGGWDFFRVMTTNLLDLLTRAEEIGFSPKTSSLFLSRHLRTQMLTSILSFKLSGRASKLSPEARAYWDGMQRLWGVYGPEPFLLFVIYPLMLVPGWLLRQVRSFYRMLRPSQPLTKASGRTDFTTMETRFFIPDITFVVFTFNEAKRLPSVIRNFRGYGPILVVDNYSTDDTVAIARASGCEVLMNRNTGWVEDFETTEKVKAAVRTSWIYWAFADEIITQDVLAEIKQTLEADRFDVISILRKNYFYGQFCREVAATYQTKAFKKDAIDFRDNTIHNFGKVTVTQDRIYRVPSDKYVHHLISNTAASYLSTINRYTDMEAASKPSKELQKPIFYYLVLPIKALWRDFLQYGGWKSGVAGISLSVMMMTYSLIRAIKGYEVRSGKDAENIREANAQIALQLLKNFP